MKTRFTILFLMLLTLSPAYGDDNLGLKQAVRTISLFNKVCMGIFSADKPVNGFIESNNLRELNGRATKQFLKGIKGKAYTASDVTGDYVVTLTEYMCTVMARKAPSNFVIEGFKKASLPKEGMPVIAVKDSDYEKEIPGGTRKILSYFLRSKSGNPVAKLQLSTSDSPKAPLQAMVTFNKLKPYKYLP